MLRKVEITFLWFSFVSAQLAVVLDMEELYFVAVCGCALFTLAASTTIGVICRSVGSAALTVVAAVLMQSSYPTGDLHHVLAAAQPAQLRKLEAEGRKSFRGVELKFSGEIVTVPKHYAHGGVKFTINATVENIRALISVVGSDVPWSEVSHLSCGDYLEGTALLTSTLGSQSAFSYFASLARKGVAADGELVEVYEIRRSRKPRMLDRFGKQIIERFESSDSLAVLLAGMFAMEDLLSTELVHLFKRTGTMHLLVVSGFHIALIYKLICEGLKKFLGLFEDLILIFPLPVLIPIVGISASALYVALIGEGVTTVRAMLAVLITAWGVTLGRNCSHWRSVNIVGGGLLFLWPGCAFEPSYQLTFAALFGLMFGGSLARKIESEYYKGKEISVRLKTERYLLSRAVFNLVVKPFTASLGAGMMTAPVTLAWFGTFAPIAPLINLIAVPFFSISVIALGGASLMLWAASLPFAELVLKLALWFVELFIDALRQVDLFATNLGLGAIDFSPPQSYQLSSAILFVILLLWLWIGLSTKLYSVNLPHGQ